MILLAARQQCTWLHELCCVGQSLSASAFPGMPVTRAIDLSLVGLIKPLFRFPGQYSAGSQHMEACVYGGLPLQKGLASEQG